MFSIDPVVLKCRPLRNGFTNKSGASIQAKQMRLSYSQRQRSWHFVFSHSCSATLSVMAEEEKETFDAERAAALVKELRECFNTGKTKSYEWRISQLNNIARMIDEKEKDILAAVHKDLSKPEQEAFISEISLPRGFCKLALKELKQWMMPEKVIV